MEDNLKEIWRPATEEAGKRLGDIEVSNLGNVRGYEWELKEYNGYFRLSHKVKKYPLHRLVAKAFPEICGEWFEECHVHHKNFNKLDNRAENLAVMDKFEHLSLHKKGLKHSDIVRAKISEGLRGRKHSEETKQRIRLSNIGNKNNLGKHHSTKTREKMSEHSPLKKTCYQYSLDGRLIKKYKSITEAARLTGSNCSHISSCCNNHLSKHNNFKWSYEPPEE